MITDLIENNEVSEGQLSLFFQMLRIRTEEDIQDHEISLFENEDEN